MEFIMRITNTLILIIFITTAVGNLSAQTFISGPQSGTLSLDTYIVTGNLSVSVGDTLLIEPGAEFFFDGPFRFDIFGTLLSIGTEGDSIKFLPNSGVTAWEGIDIAVSGSCELGFCLITSSSSSGIECSAPELVVENSTITDNEAMMGAGIHALDGASVEISECEFLNNLAEQHGGGIYFENASGNVVDSYFEGNRAENTIRGKGGGVSTQTAVVTVEGCIFTQNYAGLSGGAIGLVSSSGSVVSRCVCYDNSTSNQGGAIMLKWTSGLVQNCTLDDNNTSNSGGAIHISRDSFLDLKNCAVTNNHGPNAIFVGSTSNNSISYNDLWNNEGDNFAGNTPPGAGQITAVNANNDPCDDYFNIFLDPQYADQPLRDYYLTAGSPCIDAGDPGSPLDPDATIADIGAFYFDQGAPSVSASISAQNPPIVIPAAGGNFLYDVLIENSGGSSVTVDGWIMIRLPDGSLFGPTILREDLILAPGGSVQRDGLSQTIPAGAPAGDYYMILYLGSYPNTIITSDSLIFTKSASGLFAGTPTLLTEDSVPDDYQLLQIYPNPFNPSTEISLSLSESTDLSLTIFNVSGQKVATVINGKYQPGSYSFRFDGSNHSSGVYFAVLEYDGGVVSQQMLLVK
ncbi:hypothetical protein CEE37_05065 [candidate division LCP-89 bacterium B3_LCP]|uniref:Secretion system C-terminal sorting domain-containing protein n=1 Tax=candidate division LCP-89 bacterium B3_LCP TaxID=2012998 RepID=A0A532V1J6_UNCL8|nr:MAG: hypothetical protein CEE37_05065 [candidate division LCP-89 bacterium B3_LCP]